jgi:Fic family protein
MFAFLHGLDNDLRQALLIQIRNLWTHSSTAIEGNTLTLGETAFVLEQGLAVAGKSLNDHLEVVGHARAIEILYRLVEGDLPFTRNELFSLHKAVQMALPIDPNKPVGEWKREANSTSAVIDDRQVVFDYGKPEDVHQLMTDWLCFFHEIVNRTRKNDRKRALKAYVSLHVSFVRIHPFFDGNGRMARLISNFPLIKSGLPPIIIPKIRRHEYIDSLSSYHHAVGQISIGNALLPDPKALEPFTCFCEECWSESTNLVDDIHSRQRQRCRKKR